MEIPRSIPVFFLTAGQSRSKSSDITVDSDHAIVFGFALPVPFIRLNAKEIKVIQNYYVSEVAKFFRTFFPQSFVVENKIKNINLYGG